MKYGSYKIIAERKLVIEYYSGEINNDDLIHFKKIIREEPDYNLYYQTIIDFRHCFLKSNPQDFIKWNEFIKSNFKVDGVRKVAYLTSKPNEVVLTTLYLHLHKHLIKGFNANVFSTIEGVVSWFGRSVILEEELESILEELKDSAGNVFED